MQIIGPTLNNVQDLRVCVFGIHRHTLLLLSIYDVVDKEQRRTADSFINHFFSSLSHTKPNFCHHINEPFRHSNTKNKTKKSIFVNGI